MGGCQIVTFMLLYPDVKNKVTTDTAQKFDFNNDQALQEANADDTIETANDGDGGGTGAGGRMSSKTKYRKMSVISPAGSAVKRKNTEDQDLLEESGEYVAPYTKLEREYGCGQCRIGNVIKLNEDIYSLAYATQFKDSLLYDAIGIPPE